MVGVGHLLGTEIAVRFGVMQFQYATLKGAIDMNWDQIAGKWKQFKGDARTRWGKLTDDDLDVIEGNREKLVGKVQEKYGVKKEEADRQVNEFQESFSQR